LGGRGNALKEAAERTRSRADFNAGRRGRAAHRLSTIEIRRFRLFGILYLAHMLPLVPVTVIKYKNRKEQSRTEDVRAYAEVGSEPKTARC
jgi:hypothetical protein